MPDLAGHIRDLEAVHEVLEGELKAIARPTVLLSHTNELKIPEPAEAETDPPKNHQDNGAMPPVNTHPSPLHSPPKDTSVTSADLPPLPRVKSGDAALQVREGDLPDILLLSPKYMLYGVYQDWVHQNPVEHLDGRITEDSK